MVKIFLANTDADIAACYPVMAELRPHVPEADFVARIRRQMGIADYKLACVTDDGVKAVAGFRRSECLAWGKFIYVDDLVSQSTARGQGYGSKLLDWLIKYAREHDCDEFHLDSGVQRFGAHRFYLHKQMDITSHHFTLKLKE